MSHCFLERDGLNLLKPEKMSSSFMFGNEFMILCWATCTAALGSCACEGHRLDKHNGILGESIYF